jgi:pimeloyl-ACP methyl ester carboxylesterase
MLAYVDANHWYDAWRDDDAQIFVVTTSLAYEVPMASAPTEKSGLTFILVHGAWHGGWCWKKVVPLLRAAGHHVVALTLTGLGERAHLISPNIGLTTHVEDVVNTLEMEDLTDVILVGHSYGGLVISGVAARAASRIRRLVYLDALVAERGQSGFDLNSLQFRQRIEAAAAAHGDGYKVPPIPEILGVSDAADLQWLQPRLRPQPIASFSQPAEAPAATNQTPSTYILCTQFGFQETAAKCRAKGWPVLEIDSGHDAMVVKPRELADLLLTRDCN